MIIEIRADGAHICGYVNVPEKKSRPVPTKTYGMVIETIHPGAFQRAIDRARDIRLTVDHGKDTYASTAAGTLTLFEDGIGLYADANISDTGLIHAAQNKKIVGWSFGFTVNSDTVEPLNDSSYPLRRVTDMHLDHVSLIINKRPAYAATSWEILSGCTAKKSNELMSINESYHKRVAAAINSGHRLRVDAIKK